MADTSSSEEEVSGGGAAGPALAAKKDLEARTRAVERALGPLIEQITDIGRGELDPVRPLSPSVEKLAAVAQRATETFVSVGEQIASENPVFQEELLLACNEVRVAGERMHQAALDFSRDTLDTERREAMAEASRGLLLAVTRLLVVVDTVDSQRAPSTSAMMETKLKALHDVTSEAELMRVVRDCTVDITRLTRLADQISNEEGRSEERQQVLAAAQTQLNQASRSLITSSKTFLSFPSMLSARENRDYIIDSMTEALVAIADLTDGRDLASISFPQARGDRGGLYQHFAQFEVN
jgi:hypothetical protein